MLDSRTQENDARAPVFSIAVASIAIFSISPRRPKLGLPKFVNSHFQTGVFFFFFCASSGCPANENRFQRHSAAKSLGSPLPFRPPPPPQLQIRNFFRNTQRCLIANEAIVNPTYRTHRFGPLPLPNRPIKRHSRTFGSKPTLSFLPQKHWFSASNQFQQQTL